jgi:hypothetical protein
MHADEMNREYAEEVAADLFLEQQEKEDFEQTDEYFGYYGDCWDYDSDY